MSNDDQDKKNLDEKNQDKAKDVKKEPVQETKSDKKLPEKLSKISKDIESLTVLELAELAKYLEEKFGVSAMPVATSSAGTSSENKKEEAEKSTYNVVLTDIGSNKLGVIKAVREIQPNLGLMDAKKLVESAPKDVATKIKKEEAEAMKKKLEEAGAKVELK